MMYLVFIADICNRSFIFYPNSQFTENFLHILNLKNEITRVKVLNTEAQQNLASHSDLSAELFRDN